MINYQCREDNPLSLYIALYICILYCHKFIKKIYNLSNLAKNPVSLSITEILLND